MKRKKNDNVDCPLFIICFLQTLEQWKTRVRACNKGPDARQGIINLSRLVFSFSFSFSFSFFFLYLFKHKLQCNFDSFIKGEELREDKRGETRWQRWGPRSWSSLQRGGGRRWWWWSMLGNILRHAQWWPSTAAAAVTERTVCRLESTCSSSRSSSFRFIALWFVGWRHFVYVQVRYEEAKGVYSLHCEIEEEEEEEEAKLEDENVINRTRQHRRRHQDKVAASSTFFFFFFSHRTQTEEQQQHNPKEEF